MDCLYRMTLDDVLLANRALDAWQDAGRRLDKRVNK